MRFGEAGECVRREYELLHNAVGERIDGKLTMVMRLGRKPKTTVFDW